MAYKFQLGAARMSGSLRQEGTVRIEDALRGDSTMSASGDIYSANYRVGAAGQVVIDGSKNFTGGSISGSSTLQAGGAMTTAGTVKFLGVSDTAVAVASDSFYFKDADGTMKSEALSDYATAIAGDGLAAASGVLAVAAGALIDITGDAVAVDLTEAAAATVAAGDFMIFLDGGTSGAASKGSTGDLADLLAGGTGISAASSQLSFAASELADAAVATGDKFVFQDATDNSSKKESIDDIATLFAGNGLVAASAVLAVQVSGAVHVASDKVSISGSVAGNGLDFGGGVDSILDLSVKVDGSSIEISSDALRVKSAGITDAMLNDDVATGLAGVGLGASSGVMLLDFSELTATGGSSVPAEDSVAFLDNGVTKKITMTNFFAGVPAANGGLGSVSGTLKMDMNALTAATVDVSADSIAIVDANDSNASRKESIADLVSAMAGAGLTATNGILSSDASPTPTSHGDANATLVEGMNWSTAVFTATRTWTLPASPDAGDTVSIKAPSNAGTNNLVISRAGSQTIDGETVILIESNHGAVELVYVGGDKWVIK